jgi:NADP-dependent aldehyde dehydrogenase
MCRCEEGRYHDIQAAVLRYRARDAKAVKSITRAGMGFYQGRICGHAVAAATAALSGRAVAEVGAFLSRPIAQPVLLADMVAGRDA